MTDEKLFRQVLEALEYCIEDSAEMLTERRVMWGGYRKERLQKMSEMLDKHRAIAAALRERLGEVK